MLDERGDLELPAFYGQMIERKLLGDKTHGGFYKKERSPEGEKRLALDWKTLEYRPAQRPKFASLEMAKNVDSLGERRAHVDRLRRRKARQGRTVSLDRALRGLHLLGQPDSRDQRQRGGNRPRHAPGLQLGDGTVRTLGCDWRPGLGGAHEAGGQAGCGQRGEAARRRPHELVHGRCRNTASGRAYFDFATTSTKEEKVAPGVWSVTVARKSNGVVKANAGASLIDLGDGVGCIEFHSKMNALGADIIQLTSQVLKPGGPGEDFDAFVISNDAREFLRRRQHHAAADGRAG